MITSLCFTRTYRQLYRTLRLGVPTMSSTVLMMTASNWVGWGGGGMVGRPMYMYISCVGIVILAHGR